MATRITDGVISLRYYTSDDTDALFEAAYESRFEIGRWMDWCHPDYSMTDAVIWIDAQPRLRADGDHPFVIEDAATDRFLGATGLNQVNTVHGFANLGYWVWTSESGKGHAERAGRLVAIAALGALGLDRAEILVDTDNKPSQRVAEKLGATREGVLRNRLRHAGANHDAVMFSLVRDDLPRLISEAAAAGAHDPVIELAGAG